MFKRKGSNVEKKRLETPVPKYDKPKILLVDLGEQVTTEVVSAGFNAVAGTFGSPYKVPLGDEYLPVVGKASLPLYTEQDIIFVDLTSPEVKESAAHEKATSKGENDWWAKCSRGVIDPRPRFMAGIQRDLDRILQHGGLFVVFAEPRLSQELVWAKISYRELRIDSRIVEDNWSFLSTLSPDHLQIESTYGVEINITSHESDLSPFLKKYCRQMMYTCTLRQSWNLGVDWFPLACNKFGECVAILIEPKKTKGRILILPQMREKCSAILSLLQEVLPGISPHLFPHVKGGKWVEREEYELSSILGFKAEKTAVVERAMKQLDELDRSISAERARLGFLHGMLINSGRELVLNLRSCLEFIGFAKIVDVDEEVQTQEDKTPRQEDLQIHDRSTVVLVEAKGLSGFPTESDTIQVSKYVLRRIKEWNKPDVRGISVINHQRSIPALERDNKNVFTEQQIEDAQNNDVTLLTTWDLFLLIRGMLKWKWNPKVIQDLFYDTGRMSRVPAHYKPIGRTVNYWEKPGVVGVELCDGELRTGERVGYVVSEGYLEQEALSVQIDNADVEDAHIGQVVGIRTEYPKDFLPKGTLVCLVGKQIS